MKFSKLVKEWRGKLDWWISVEPDLGLTWFYKGNIGDMPLALYLAIADLKVIWYGDWGCDDEYVESRFEVRLSRPENDEFFEMMVERYGVKKNNDV